MNSCENFRNATINEPRIFGPQSGIQTAMGRIPTMQSAPPPVPPRPYSQSSNPLCSNQMGMYGNNMYGNSMYASGGGYGMNPYSMGGYGGAGYGLGAGFNRFGSGMYGSAFGARDPMDPENRFIQLAEESSRPAFQSIESLVMAIGNIAAMLDSTFFALTSSFRAILGVAANFGRLRGVFAQFWSTFALLRGITWLYKKALYMLGVTKADPSTIGFNDIFSAAANGITGQTPDSPDNSTKRPSFWPILTFLGFIFATPYLIMKLIGQVSTTAIEESKNPTTWVNPHTSQALYSFKASNSYELSMQAGQKLIVAPREVQQTQKLLNTGWALASIDNQTSGLIPISYVRRIVSNSNGMNETINSTPTVPMKLPNDSMYETDAPVVTNLEQMNKENTAYDVPIDVIQNDAIHTDAIVKDLQDL